MFEEFEINFDEKNISSNYNLITSHNAMFYILIARIICFSTIVTLNQAVLSVKVGKFCEIL